MSGYFCIDKAGAHTERCYSVRITGSPPSVAILINKNIPIAVQETISDPLGHYVLINCQIYSEQWTFLNLYAPNYDDISFIQDIILKVSGGHEHFLTGGDFNFCLDTILDKSATSTSKSKSASTTLSFMKDFNLTDVWK